MLLRLTQLSNAHPPILVKPFGRLTEVKLVQYSNTAVSNTASEEGSSAYCKPLHSLNADFSIVVRPSGNVMLLRLTQLSNAHAPILVKPFGKLTAFKLLQ